MLDGRTAPLLMLLGCAVWGPMAPAQTPSGISQAASPPQSAAHPAPALAGLEECIRRLDPQADIGFERIAVRCPDLAQQLEHGAWARWLPRDWRGPGNDLSAASLQELRELATRELATTLSPRSPDVQSLRGVLATLGNKTTEKATGWSRFKNWLRSIFASREDSDNGGWLTHMISRVGFSQSMLDLISYAALATVVALAVLIVLNELRVAGILEKRRAGRRMRGGQRDLRVIESGWQRIQHAQPADRPRLLLELIATRLAGPPFVPPSRALTVRELARTAPVSEPADRARLAELASVAERVRFSGHEVPADMLEEPVAQGRELLDRLAARAQS